MRQKFVLILLVTAVCLKTVLSYKFNEIKVNKIENSARYFEINNE